MLHPLTFFFISMCVFIGNVDARSRNPRTTDFDEIARLVQADFEEYRQEKQGEGIDLKDLNSSIRGDCYPQSRLSVDHDAGIIKWYTCVLDEHGHQAYLNELELSKATFDGHVVRIPCKANSQCVMGKQKDKSVFWFYLYSKSKHSFANQIIELLKPN